MRFTGSILSSLALACAGACASPPPSKHPPQRPGCDVATFHEEPSYATENIGPVSANCDETISDEDCLRELKDQACKLGADTLWGVNDPPTKHGGKKSFNGRAAHQK